MELTNSSLPGRLRPDPAEGSYPVSPHSGRITPWRTGVESASSPEKTTVLFIGTTVADSAATRESAHCATANAPENLDV